MHSLLVLAALVYLQAPVIAGNGTITGRVLSVDGMPASGVRVTAMTPREPGQPDGVSIHANITQTDSFGRYRLENVSRGRYYITAGLLDSPTYYPGVSALAAATVVVIADEFVKDGVDFQIQIPPGVKVSGRLLVLPTLRSTPTKVRLTGGTPIAVLETAVNPDGTFEFSRVARGNYRLNNFFGLPQLTVSVTDRDVTGLEIGRDASGVRVSGRVISSDPSPSSLSTVSVLLNAAPGSAPLVPALVMGYASRPDATGSFEFLRVPPGNYSLRVLQALPCHPCLLWSPTRRSRTSKFRFLSGDWSRVASCSRMETRGSRFPAAASNSEMLEALSFSARLTTAPLALD